MKKQLSIIIPYLNEAEEDVVDTLKSIYDVFDSNLIEETRKASLDLFWLFGWQPDNLSTINKDLETLINGTMI